MPKNCSRFSKAGCRFGQGIREMTILNKKCSATGLASLEAETQIKLTYLSGLFSTQ